MAPPVDLTEATLALSDALDLVGVKVVQHGKRVAWMALETARMLGLAADDRGELFRAGLLHDIGVSSSRVHEKLMSEVDWEGSPEHCLRGFVLLSEFQPFARIAEAVRFHHTHAHDPAREEATPEIFRIANLVHLADRADAFAAQTSGPILLRRTEVRARVRALSGAFFDPDLVEAFLDASAAESFWLMLEPHHLDREIAETAQHYATPQALERGDLRDYASIFARIVDDKSRFTAEHSHGVARLAVHLGRLAGIPLERLEMLEIAGLLHDVGKLRVADRVLEKPSGLDPEEFAQIERHTFETWQILRRIRGLGDVARWAAFHHEALAGTGYPFHFVDGEIPLEARIVAVADVFQAMAQDRPYRPSAGPRGALMQVQKEAHAGKLDADIVALVEKDLLGAWDAATGSPSENADVPSPS